MKRIVVLLVFGLISGHPVSAQDGLRFHTGNTLRMLIDEFGRIGINSAPDSEYRLRVGGTIYSSIQFVTPGPIIGGGHLEMGGRASINSSSLEEAALFVKGRTGTPSNWGQHIVLERAGESTDRAGILLDGDGIKMRFLHATGQYYWRNSDNNNMMRLDADRNLFVGGAITANGRGVVSSPNASQWQVREMTVGNLSFASFGPGGFLSFNVDISGLGFSSAPHVVSMELIDTPHSVSGSMLLTPDVSATQVTIGIRNVGTGTFTDSSLAIRILMMGLR